MFVHAVNSTAYTPNVIENRCSEDNSLSEEEIFYWRKHPNLHGWFRDLFYRKGGHRDSQFNGDYVRIELKDIIELEKTIKEDKLPETYGFFFGESIHHITYQNDLKFIAKAKEALAENKILYYTSSW